MNKALEMVVLDSNFMSQADLLLWQLSILQHLW